MAGTRLVFNKSGLKEILKSRHGPVAKDIARRCQRVETRAKIYATGQGGGPRVRFGRLRGSITWVLILDGGEVTGFVGTNVEYALPLELGWTSGGRRHGPYPFLRPALAAAR